MRSNVISKFLIKHTHPDLANLYNPHMQCHVLVAADGANRDGSTFSDGIETWYPFVISDESSNNKLVTYNFEKHIEGIGLTGWDWHDKVTRWVAFDFDSLIGHKKGLTDGEIKEIISSVSGVDWITIRKSTGGKGLHLYVQLESPIPTADRSEHSALARAVLHKLSAQTGVPFKDKVDICGGNMFVWHRKMSANNQGLILIKQGEPLDDVTKWEEQLDFIKSSKPKSFEFDAIALSKIDMPLDPDHTKLINYLQDLRAMWYWNADKHLLICHTADLAEAHVDLQLKGIFKTVASGNNRPDINCFAYPIRDGGWVVRRFGYGTTEDTSWDLDDKNWRKCYFNVDADIKTASMTFNGVEHPSGAYVFQTTEHMCLAALALGVYLKIPNMANYCGASIKPHKDGRLVITIEDKDHKIPMEQMQGWIKEKTTWKRLFVKTKTSRTKEENNNFDDFVRHMISPSGEDYGWAIHTENGWNFEALAHVRLVLESMDMSTPEVRDALGNAVMRCWKIVNVPFKEEYPGGRQWNRKSAQLRYVPSVEVPLNLKEKCPAWWRVLDHCGRGLDDTLKTNENFWAKHNHIYNGIDYLICWISSMFQEPTEPLPYLFFYGPQNSGKSIFHEALSLLMTHGVIKADAALVNKSGFNAELESAVLCVVEEVNLAKSHEAANRIKDWVTAREILIHPKGKTPYTMPNVSHWIQGSNNHDACPIFPGDTRVVVLFVDNLNPKELIPKRQLIDLLTEEAKDFLSYVINFTIPESYDRLNVPVITTMDKSSMESANKTLLEMFIEEVTYPCDGEMVKYSDFYEKFIEWLGPTTEHWSIHRVGKELPPKFPKGRIPKTGQFYIGNMTFEEGKVSTGKCIRQKEFIIKMETIKEIITIEDKHEPGII